MQAQWVVCWQGVPALKKEFETPDLRMGGPAGGGASSEGMGQANLATVRPIRGSAPGTATRRVWHVARND